MVMEGGSQHEHHEYGDGGGEHITSTTSMVMEGGSLVSAQMMVSWLLNG